jgi:TRAP-type C4-dicarboxylate transport system permease small subunit
VIAGSNQKGIEYAMTENTGASGSLPDRPMLTWRWVFMHLEEVLTALLLAVMIGSVGIGVFCRFVLHQPLSWTEEVILVCMVWMCFLGASVATKHNEHIFIDFVVTLVPRRLAKIMGIASMVLVSGVLVILVWQGILLVERTQDVATIALGIPTMYMYAAIPISAFLMLIHNLRNLVAAIRSWV